jgi:hypothetical protein
VIEARSAHPLVSLKVLRRRTVALGNIGGLLAFATGSAIAFIGMLFLQQVNGLSPLRAGLVFGWLGVLAAVSGTLAPRVIGRYGSRTVLVARAARAGRRHGADRDDDARRQRAGAAARRQRLGLRQPARGRRLQRDRDLRPAERGAGARDRPGHDDPAGGAHRRHPDHERGRLHPGERAAALRKLRGRRPDRRVPPGHVDRRGDPAGRHRTARGLGLLRPRSRR